MSFASGGTTTNYIWDVARKIPTVIDDGTYQYGYGMGLAELGIGYYFLPDALGSTLALINGVGGIFETYSYDPFGNVTASSGSQPTNFQFTGQQTDSTGLQSLGARYYDPGTGRFLSQDPAGGGGYGYAGGNPTGYTDPTGRDLCWNFCNWNSPTGDPTYDPPAGIQDGTTPCPYDCEQDPTGANTIVQAPQPDPLCADSCGYDPGCGCNVGPTSTTGPGDISEHKHDYLAKGHRQHHAS